MYKKKPYVMYAIIAINILVFVLLEIIGSTKDSEFMYSMGAMYPDSITNDKEYWRFFTATFMHFGIMHLANNMIMLGASGVILEDALGHVKYLILYMLAGVGGNILSYLQMIETGQYAVAAGASGAIFGGLGALLWIVIKHKGHYKTLTKRGVIFMIALALYYGLTTAGVDNWGHIGGLIAGFVLAILLYRENQQIEFKGSNDYN